MDEADYWRAFKESLLDLDDSLSRTAKGVVETGVSDRKVVAISDNPAVLVKRNREAVCGYLQEVCGVKPSVSVCKGVVFQIASIALAGFHVPLFREWSSPYKQSRSIEPDTIETELDRFYVDLFSRVSAESREGCAFVAAWAEYKLNVELHPFYDACSRVSRYVAAWVLCKYRRLPPMFASREQYWLAVDEGIGGFAARYSLGVEMREKKMGLCVSGGMKT